MPVLHTWAELGIIGAATNAAVYLCGLRGWFGSQYRNHFENLGEYSEEHTGYRWMIAVLSAAMGFIVPPMALANLAYMWWMVHSKRSCSGKNVKRTLEDALARKAELLAEGFPEEDLWAGRCTGGDHFHVKVRVGTFGDIERKRKRLAETRDDAGNGSTGSGENRS